MEQPPDGIIITVGAKMWGHHGYRVWLRNFLQCMQLSCSDISDPQDFFYHFRQGNQPKSNESLRHIYLCIGNRIRWRVFYAGSKGPETMVLATTDGKTTKTIEGKAWVVAAGPAERAPFKIEKKGFQGFRYTQALW